MTSSPRDRLYSLLPAIYRIRDAAAGDPLKALLAVIEQELDIVEQDINDLYDNWFIETCADWVVPYIGDLLDVRELYTENSPASSQVSQQGLSEESSPVSRQQRYGQLEWRAYVANTLAYRRRKGTAPILEQLTRDVTGWRSRAVEFARLVSTTQNLNHVRPASTTVDLRADNVLQVIGTPFEQQAAYTTEVRSVSRGGRYNVAYIGLFVWRLQSYPMERSTARMVEPWPDQDQSDPGRYYTFSPLGYGDIPLFNQPQTETNIVKLAKEINVPAKLRRPILANEIQQRRYARLQGEPIDGVRYFDSDPVLQIFINGQPNPIPPEEILICRLAPETTPTDTEAAAEDDSETSRQSAVSPPWQLPSELYQKNRSNLLQVVTSSQNTNVPLPTSVVAVDPELGRMAFLDRPFPRQVDVSYLYGFSDDLGGGAYGREDFEQVVPKRLEPGLLDQTQIRIPPLFWRVEQATSAEPNPLKGALQAWNQTVSLWQGLQTHLQYPTHIPLASITIPAVQVSKIELESVPKRQPFRPGILGDGLRVTRDCLTDRLIVTPGLAIDRQGRRIQLRQPHDLSLDLNAIDWQAYPNAIGLVALSYRATLEGPHWQLSIIPETALAGYPEGEFIPLARLIFDPKNKLLRTLDVSLRPLFQPGIVQGLQVKTRPGTLDTWLTPGKAVDKAGQIAEIETTQALEAIVSCQGQVRHVCLTREIRQRSWQIRLLPTEALLTDEDDLICLRLASLDIPRVTINQNKIEQNDIRSAFKAAFSRDLGGTLSITGFEVETAAPNQARITVNPGQVQFPEDANSPSEDALTLESTTCCDFDLSQYAGRSLLLTVSVQPDQGLPLPPTYTSQNEQDWRHFAIAPPIDTETPGVILIQDNKTYTGDLSVIVPPQQKLWVVAANGNRPHIHGNLWIRGTAPENLPDQGELYLDGLLVEGKVTVLAGNLATLGISHCTLVPQVPDKSTEEVGSLQVNSSESPQPSVMDPPEETLTLLSLVISCLLWMWYFISRDLGLEVTAPQPKPAELMQQLYQWWRAFLASLFQFMQGIFDAGSPWPDSNILEWDPCTGKPTIIGQDNNRLSLQISHSITGPILIAETVPDLSITNSIIDKGQRHDSTPLDTSGIAIAAGGTTVVVDRSTILGMTAVRSLEASDSIFDEKVIAMRHQIGCIRFSYVPEGSQTPRRYQCQPDLAFNEELDRLPTGITTLALTVLNQETSALFAGTAGGGLFRLFSRGNRPDDTSSLLWQDITQNLYQSYITAISVTQSSGQFPLGHSLWVGTSGGMVFRSESLATGLTLEEISPSTAWSSVSLTATNSAITSICHCTRPGTGQLTYLGHGQPSYSLQITGVGTQFNQELRVGDTITVLLPGEVKETRIVSQIVSDTEVLINQGFNQNFTEVAFEHHAVWIGTLGSGVFRTNEMGDSLRAVNDELPNLLITALVTNSQGELFASTWGDGVYHYVDWRQWIPINTKLSSLNVTCLIFQTNGDLLAGTDRGAFRLVKDETYWSSIHKSLTNFYVSSLAVFPAQNENSGVGMDIENNDELSRLESAIYVGTNDGKIFANLNRESWQIILDLKGLEITALAADAMGNLFAGTRAGNMLHYVQSDESSQEKRWVAINTGLPNVADKLLIMDRLQPNFTSTRYGDPGYSQLRQSCAREILTGAEDGSEMGVFSSLKNPQREANLRVSLDEYLRFGLAAEIFYMT
jgi:hypothetical protein